MKKLIASVMVLLLAVISLAGCGATNAAPQAAEKTFKVGIVQIVEHPSLDEIRNAFVSQLESDGYGSGKVTVDYQNAQGDMNTVNSICQKFAGDKVDLIVAIATPSAQGAAAATTEIPVLFAAVSDPKGAGLVENFDKPEGNITGTADVVPVEQIFAMASKMVPDIKTYGFIYNLSEANSVTNIGIAKAYCDDNGIAYIESCVNNAGEVQQAAQSLIGRVDAVFSPNDNTVASAMPTLAQVCTDAKLPVFVGADSMVNDGGLASVSVQYTFLGQESAKMAEKLLSGTPVSDVPVYVIDQYVTVVNQETAATIGVDVSAFVNK